MSNCDVELIKEQLKQQQLHRESESDKASSGSVPVYHRYTFVNQMIAAIRRIGSCKYFDGNINNRTYVVNKIYLMKR